MTWGQRARALVDTTRRLLDHHWDDIEAHAYVYVKGTTHDDKEDGEGAVGAAIEEYGLIDLDWLVFLRIQSTTLTLP